MADITARIQQAATRNAELQRTLRDTDHAAPAHKAQSRFIDDLQKQIWSSDKDIQELERRRVKELSDHEKYRDSTVKRFLFKASGQAGKFADKAEKEEREYFAILEKEHGAKKVNAGLKGQLEEAVRAREELESLRQVHQHAQRELDNLYHEIFAGSTPSFPQEDQLERVHNQALQDYHDTRVRQETGIQGTKLLVTALQKLEEAAEHMSMARNYSTADVMSSANVYDAMERSEVNQAAILVKEVLNLCDRAGVSGLPDVEIYQGSVVGDYLFDSTRADIGFHQQIQRGIEEIDSLTQAVKFKLGSVNTDKNSFEADLRQKEFYLEETRRNLQLERQRVFEQVASAPEYQR